jgi:S-DNA-T family DNA segregation ATPase FtsK/SpoIIIE
LPHTAAVITNLYDQLPLVDRMSTRSTASCSPGRSCSERSGNFANLRDYERE